MTDDTVLWKAMREKLPRGTWIPVGDIFLMVKRNIPLDKEDLAVNPSRLGLPQWKTNVQDLLRSKRRAGAIRSRRRSK